MLAAQAQRRPAGDQQPQPRAPAEQPGGAERGVGDVFEAVQYQQPRPVADQQGDRLRRIHRCDRGAQCRGERGGYVVGAGQRAEVDAVDAVEGGRDLPGDLGHEPGLADPARSGDGDQAGTRTAQQPP